MPDDFSLSSTDTIIKSPALNTIEPVGTAKASGKLLQPVADAILDQRQALLIPILRLSDRLLPNRVARLT